MSLTICLLKSLAYEEIYMKITFISTTSSMLIQSGDECRKIGAGLWWQRGSGDTVFTLYLTIQQYYVMVR